MPRAQAAASSNVSVAPTLGKRRVKSVPWSPPGAASTSFPAPASSSFAPIRASPSRCKSMGRAPILHPPGSEVSARPSRASSGAQKRMEARICAAVSPGRVLFEGIPATTMSAPCQWAAHPAPRSSPRLHSTSDSLGTARSRTGPRQRSAAARSGSTLFFAAGIAAVPFSGRPPITQIRPLCCVISAAPIPQKIPHDMQKQGRMSRFEFVERFVRLRSDPPSYNLSVTASPCHPPSRGGFGIP